MIFCQQCKITGNDPDEWPEVLARLGEFDASCASEWSSSIYICQHCHQLYDMTWNPRDMMWYQDTIGEEIRAAARVNASLQDVWPFAFDVPEHHRRRINPRKYITHGHYDAQQAYNRFKEQVLSSMDIRHQLEFLGHLVDLLVAENPDHEALLLERCWLVIDDDGTLFWLTGTLRDDPYGYLKEDFRTFGEAAETISGKFLRYATGDNIPPGHRPHLQSLARVRCLK